MMNLASFSNLFFETIAETVLNSLGKSNKKRGFDSSGTSIEEHKKGCLALQKILANSSIFHQNFQEVISFSFFWGREPI